MHKKGFIFESVLIIVAVFALVWAFSNAKVEPETNGLVFGAPIQSIQRNLVPETDSVYYLGTTTPSTMAWKGLIVDEVCLTADSCKTAWPVGGSGGGADFPSVLSWGNATSTTLGFLQGFLSTASSTIDSDLYVRSE